ncbi:ARS binding protein 2 [Penicillium alfredii]|uniref:ARS binding protein 2 n=1 Tax=Penicillium alfredii TaxID=1506179 RepID=A0A9W9GAS1_9EURO|nr:ARS binding protein 2 [Penicillium alfredii]KAJ5115301.1 ARS binding protein 2 [Penicillium alfredii]
METTFPVIMDSTDRSNSSDLGGPQMVIQQYARYPATLESTLQSASSLGSARSQLDMAKSPPLQRKGTPRSLHSSPRGMRSAIPPSSAVRSGPSMSPPLFDALRHRQMKDPADQAESRALPSRNVSDETIDDAYVLFILYCNPNVPSNVETSELRKCFRCPPRSDGKSFNIFTLFELIRKLDNKELKTWIQLAIELGVEPPSIEKKQSTQKVQQYAVRLKRWMRAMHVDAFFEFCLDHPHPYYTHLPPSGPFVTDSRDGVPLEEDLALRALVPQWKPKRGRKRADERELDDEKAYKRPQLDTSVGGLHQGSFQANSVIFPQSAIPFSAFPEDMESNDPWMTAASSFPPGGGPAPDQQGQDLRWRLPDREASPANYPQSAIVPRQSSDILMSSEPRSAVTPSSGEKSRARRRHGPAVSSAWPNSNGSSTGKSRGRPPNKGSTSGSFSTFQLNSSQESPQVPNSVVPSESHVLDRQPPNPMPNSSYNQSPTPANHGRPGKLQLQVPQHPGAPVRLATPPTLQLNGVNGAVISGSEDGNGPHEADGSSSQTTVAANRITDSHEHNPRRILDISINDLVCGLTVELLRARLIGRAAALSPDEARAVASQMVADISVLHSSLPHGPHSNSMLAFHLGMGHHFGILRANPGSMVVKIDPPCRNTNVGGAATGSNRHAGRARYTVSYDYNLYHDSSMQIIIGVFEPDAWALDPQHQPVEAADPAHDVENDPADFELEDDEGSHTVSEATWKQRYMKLRAQMQKKDRSLAQYKRNIVESVMADI